MCCKPEDKFDLQINEQKFKKKQKTSKSSHLNSKKKE